jgi:signal transduction histidine kinase
MRQAKISTYFNAGITGILVVVFAVICIASVWLARTSTINSVLSRLDVCLQTAYDRFDLLDGIGTAKVQDALNYEDVASYIESNDASDLNKVLDRCKASRGESYLVAVDSDGVVVAGNVHALGSAWPLSYLLGPVAQEKKPITTTEIITADELEGSRQSFCDSAKVVLDRTTGESFNDAYVHIIVCPVYDGNTFVGVIVAGYLLNNNSTLPADYTEAVPETYLSIGTTEGTRICSNISSGDFSYLAGTTQKQDFVDAINGGGIWRGVVSMTGGGEGVVVAGPIKNYAGEVIGNVGVGSPAFMVAGLSFGSYSLIFLATAALFGCALLVGRKLTAKISQPISDLQEISRAIASGEMPSADILQDRRGTPVEIISLADDMFAMAYKLTSENQRLEEKVSARTAQLASTVDELKAANRHKSQFLANISHELRTPLNSIIGFASLLQDNVAGTLNERQAKYVTVIIESSNHLLDLVNDILQLVKLDTSVDKLKPVQVSICEVVRKSAELVQPLVDEKNQTLKASFGAGVEGSYAYWDEQKIRQILLNLLSNAVKFTPEGGHIRMEVTRANGSFVFIHVIDDGIGISDDMKERVFLAFEQADNSYTRIYKGAGLGLAITKELVELHGGRIWLEDAPGGGLDACVELPFRSDGIGLESTAGGKST